MLVLLSEIYQSLQLVPVIILSGSRRFLAGFSPDLPKSILLAPAEMSA